MNHTFMNEQLSLSESNPMKARFFDYDHFVYPWHFHDEYEIIYVREGSGERFVADSMEPYTNGDLILIGSNVPHYMKSGPEYFQEDSKERVKGVIIQFRKDFMQYSINNYADMKQIKQLLLLSNRGVHFPSSKNKKIVKLVEQTPGKNGIRQIISLLYLLYMMSKSRAKRILGSENYAEKFNQYTDDRFKKIYSYLTLHYLEKIKLEDVASMIPMNASSFCRYFREKSGKTFVRFIQELRIAHACQMLLEEKKDIMQVSVESGFNTINHFNHIFKEVTKLSPSDYRHKFLE